MYQIPRKERLKQRVLEMRSLGSSGLLYLREEEIPLIEEFGVQVIKTVFRNSSGDLVVCQIIPHSKRD